MLPALAWVVRPRYPNCAPFVGELSHLRAVPVVEEVGLVRVTQSTAPRECRLDDLAGLVVGGYKDIDAVAGSRRGAPRLRPAPTEEGKSANETKLYSSMSQRTQKARVGRPACLEEPPGDRRSPSRARPRWPEERQGDAPTTGPIGSVAPSSPASPRVLRPRGVVGPALPQSRSVPRLFTRGLVDPRLLRLTLRVKFHPQ